MKKCHDSGAKLNSSELITLETTSKGQLWDEVLGYAAEM